MKANELMIGDIVSHNGIPVKIEVIAGMYSYVVPVKDNLGYLNKGFEVDNDELTPIPITPDILGKNDFLHFHPENRKAEYWQIYIKGGDINVKITYGHFRFRIYGKPLKDGAFRPSFNGHLCYVHELQNVLRLCGIEREIIL